jgi:uncharacterized protein (DUF58 family)
LAFGAIPLLLVGVWAGFFEVALLWFGACIAAVWLDWKRLPSPSAFVVKRDTDPRLIAQTEGTILLLCENNSSQSLPITLLDTLSSTTEHDLPSTGVRFVSQAHTRHTLSYHVTPKERGKVEFGAVWIRMEGSLGLVARQWSVPLPASLPVYPNLFQDASIDLIARRGRLQMGGMRSVRVQGIGQEFESLRDYQPDDEMRRIDWKATARRGRLIARQYEAERSQNIFLVFDVGRTMLAEVAGRPKIDYALNAALLLAYVATQSEDHVGLLVFSDKVHTYIPPRKGAAQMEALLHALHNVQASLVEADYERAFAEFQSRWRKRALLLCFTDLWDAMSSHNTIQEIAKMQAHHLVATVSLLDSNLLQTAEQAVTTTESVYTKAAAWQVLAQRREALEQLQQYGVLVIDTPAEKLSAELVRRYLEIKDRILL